MLKRISPSSPPHGLQRARGVAEIGVSAARLERFYQSGCLKLLRPKRFQNEMVLINTSGGLTSGDEIRIEADIGTGAHLALTTQAAERIYRGEDQPANVRTCLKVGAGGKAEWLPQETILFDGARLNRKLKVDLKEGAEFLGVEALYYGRAAMGECVETLDLSDRFEIHLNGEPLWRDHFQLSDAKMLRSKFGLNNARASAMVIAVRKGINDELPRYQSLLQGSEIGAVSSWENIIVMRFLAPNARQLKSELTRILQELRCAPLPEVWRI